MKKIFAAFFLINLVFAEFNDARKIPDFAKTAVENLTILEIIEGDQFGNFLPNNPINRAEFCKILVRATGADEFVPLLSSFSDIEPGDWFFKFVETAKKNGWIGGHPDGSFRPSEKINRAAVAKILVLAFSIEIPQNISDEIWYEKYFAALAAQNFLPHGISLENLQPAEFPTRAEITEQIFRIMKKLGKFSPLDLQKISENSGEQNLPEKILDEKNPDENLPENVKIPDFENIFIDQKTPINLNAGILFIEKSAQQPQKISVARGQKNQIISEFELSASSGEIKISSIRVQRVGNGEIGIFAKMWAEVDGKIFSRAQTPIDDSIIFVLNSQMTVAQKSRKIIIKADIADDAEIGTNSRFALFLPEWIDSSTTREIGFFPISGTDIFVEK